MTVTQAREELAQYKGRGGAPTPREASIEYRYRVICADNGHRPTILTEKVEG